MPYPINSYFNPSDKYKQTWSLVPQVRRLELSGHKTKSLFSDLSSSIPIFYVLMFSAIAFDIYLGFNILAKSGVSFGLVVGSVVADFFLGILPFLIENNIKSLNHVRIENLIFQKELECKTKKFDEEEANFEQRRSNIITGELSQLKSNKFNSKIVRLLIILVIFFIAAWKIFTYINVLPPGMSVFSMVNGKIVIIFALLTALFHIIGTEKAFAHFMFWTKKGGEFKSYQKTHNAKRPIPQSKKIEYAGKYIESSFGNTSILKKDDEWFINFIHIIKDDEIQSIINSQTDEDAKRGVAIKCKENQIF